MHIYMHIYLYTYIYIPIHIYTYIHMYRWYTPEDAIWAVYTALFGSFPPHDIAVSVSHVDESCLTYQRKSWCTYEWVMSHVGISHSCCSFQIYFLLHDIAVCVRRVNESSKTHEWIKSNVWQISRVTHVHLLVEHPPQMRQTATHCTSLQRTATHCITKSCRTFALARRCGATPTSGVQRAYSIC